MKGIDPTIVQGIFFTLSSPKEEGQNCIARMLSNRGIPVIILYRLHNKCLFVNLVQ